MMTPRWTTAVLAVGLMIVGACQSTPTEASPVAADSAGPQAQGSHATVAVEVPALKSGEKAKATVTITPAKGYHWNLEYPAKLQFEGTPAKVSLVKALFKQMAGDFDASEEKAAIAVPLEGKAQGEETVTGTLKFSVCNDTTCLIESAAVSLALKVTP